MLDQATTSLLVPGSLGQEVATEVHKGRQKSLPSKDLLRER